jgi:ribosomal-protein-alanine N-acetyltransferase
MPEPATARAPGAIETVRLTGALLGGGDDEAALRRIHGDPRAAATLTADKRPVPLARTRGLIDEMRRQQAADGFGLWLFRLKDAEGDAFAGYCGLRRQTVRNRPEIELLYAVMADLWGRGLATEMAAAVLERADETFKLRDTVAFTLTTNRASARVMEKSGYRFEATFRREGLPHLLYRRKRPG